MPRTTRPVTAPGAPPEAPRHPFSHTEHGVERPDPYHWLGGGDPAVLDHLVAERAFYDASVAHLASLGSALKSEMLSRLPTVDESARWSRKRYTYWTRHPVNSDYAELWRLNHDSAAGSTTESESSSMFFDIGGQDRGTGYLDLGLTLLSPDEDLLAYSVDAAGDEVFELCFRDLRTGEDLPDRIPRSYYTGAWSADSRFFFYTVHDEAYRPYQVWRHRLGSDVADDDLVLEEPDQRFELEVDLTRSGGLVVLTSSSRVTSEVWVVEADAPESVPRSVGGRRHGVRYDVEHVGDSLLVVTNDGAVEFRLMRAPVPTHADQDHDVWTEARPENDEERLLQVDAFAGAVVLSFRADGQHRLRILSGDDLAGDGIVLSSRADVGCLSLARNELYDAHQVTVCDETYLRPPIWYAVDLRTGEATEVHRGEAPGFDPSSYALERRTFPAPDGTPVPAVLLRHRDTPLDGSAPALLYAYGAYEAVDEPEWDAALPSVLDRGVVWVHALVRGGGDGGRRWWLDGSMADKQHTFDDLIAVADGLAGASGAGGAGDGLVDGDRIATRGLSAGGLLQGAVFSQRPDRWRAVVAEVPFVDVVTTMFDACTPLTITEWEEWGDPRIREQFDWLVAYSPYDNVPPAGGRPDLLVTGAVHDPRVMVREPAKWVAALRHSDPTWSPRLLFRCETAAGAHVGPSGRIGHLSYEAEIHAWILDRLASTERVWPREGDR